MQHSHPVNCVIELTKLAVNQNSYAVQWVRFTSLWRTAQEYFIIPHYVMSIYIHHLLSITCASMAYSCKVAIGNVTVNYVCSFTYNTVGFWSMDIYFFRAEKCCDIINSHVCLVDYNIGSPCNTFAWLVILKLCAMYCSCALGWALMWFWWQRKWALCNQISFMQEQHANTSADYTFTWLKQMGNCHVANILRQLEKFAETVVHTCKRSLLEMMKFNIVTCWHQFYM